MSFALPSLPYAYNALEPFIDEQTMHLHHDKHHQTYIDKLNAAIAGKTNLESMSVEDLLKNIATIPEEIRTAVRNHGGGHSNHSIFWTILAPTGQSPSETIKNEVTKVFGSWDGFVQAFNTAAINQFGSGWAWLTKKDGKLEVKGYANQDSPYIDGATPILGIDVWEHAYYLKYQNRRPEYISAFWNVINWAEVEKRWNA
ncbi:superoxide dismutase [Candidatus Cerribacteria bacterium 'Amazon FNV 2010 28 9']|uniref:Superoxide dismutase n=1 Tax=Candidatus Cerribacteria bacterium 'Amazon FNV 2010 28 9' TaxID=2081795 RepID=A0A317JU07_9BACT|nr:MAG: superoxide dismutase [Candidatus Cerribacteria bacterium 'Amazon FNV 2010 28 9']